MLRRLEGHFCVRIGVEFGRRWMRMVGNGSGDVRRGREKVRLKWFKR
jgi:hypothetical protein